VLPLSKIKKRGLLISSNEGEPSLESKGQKKTNEGAGPNLRGGTQKGSNLEFELEQSVASRTEDDPPYP